MVTRPTQPKPEPKPELRPLHANPSDTFDTYIVANEDEGTAAVRKLLDLGVTAVTVAFPDGKTKTYRYV